MPEHPFGVPTAVDDFSCGRCGTLLDGGTDEPVVARNLRVERDRYREALEKIIATPGGEHVRIDAHDAMYVLNGYEKCQALAASALDEKEER